MKTRLLAQRLSLLTGVAALLIAGAALAVDVHVMISAGFYSAYSDAVPAFERETGHKLITVRGPSLGDSPEAIPNRLKRGEPADVVIGLAASIDDLGRQGLVRPASKVDLARSEIGMVVRAGRHKPDIGTVDAFRRALVDAKSIAYSDSGSGIYLSTTLFAKLGVADRSRARAAKCGGRPRASRLPRSLRAARRRSAFSR